MRSLHTGQGHEIAPGELLTQDGRFFEVRELDAAQVTVRLDPDTARTALAMHPAELTSAAFRAQLRAMELTHDQAGALIGVRRETIGEWCRGVRPVPRYAWDSLTLERVRRDLTLALTLKKQTSK